MKPRQQQATFKLFKSTSPNQAHPYTGSVALDGKTYAIDAWVVEHDDGKGGKAKHFEGTVAAGKALERQMVKSAKEKAPDDLLKALEDKPFDDVDALRAAIPLSQGSGEGS